ncbi:MAG: GspH/FimT family pseudopilin [Gammaproteobacteria bacterium]
MDDRADSGYTLVELLVTLAVLAILTTVALPAFTDLIDNQRLRAAAQQIATDLRYARGESIKRHTSTPIGVSFSPGDQWCYGISQQLPCDCRVQDPAHADACRLDLSQQRQLHAPRPHAHIALIDARFSGTQTTAFDPLRGSARAGSVALRSARGKQLEVRVSTLGRVRICAPADGLSPAGYAPC